LTLPTATVIYEPESFISVLCARQLKILADETRLALELLWSGPKHVGEMNALLGLEQSLLSHHLKVRDEGFVMATRDGKYQLESSVLSANGGSKPGMLFTHLTEALNSSPGKNTILNNR